MRICGVPLIAKIIRRANLSLSIEDAVTDGSSLVSGDTVATLYGETAEILSIERIILNFLQRLSGIATLTASFVALAPKLKILDTRKTTPGHRVLEKYSVTVGGGTNHRLSLSHLVMLKNNHLDSNEDLNELFLKIRSHLGWGVALECEVRNNEELKRVLPFKPECILLDNMTIDEIRNGALLIREVHPGCKIEASGGITKEQLTLLNDLPIDGVSLGSLTTKVSNVDINLRLS
jgi:nicotinate-nucleotide pyrophosphorylase (carboxylating)